MATFNVITTPTGVKIGSKGRVASTREAVSTLLGSLDKGQARQVRMKLRRAGKPHLAGSPRSR